MMKTIQWAVLLVVGLAWTGVATGQAADADGLDELVRSVQAQQRRIERLQGRLDEVEKTDRREQLLDFEKQLLDIRQQLGQVSGADMVPGWMSRDLKFYADVRIRYEGNYFDDRTYNGTNPNTGVERAVPHRIVGNDLIDRHRLRYRLRFGFEKAFGPEWSAGFGLASTLGGATSKNVTMTGYFGEDELGIDKAWIRYTPTCVPGLAVTGGKFANPFVHTDMVWDSDVNPEGLVQQYTVQTDGNFVPFVTLGQLIANEQANDRDLLCFAWQAGFRWSKIANAVDWTCALTFYDWDGFEDEPTLSGAPGIANVWPRGRRTYTRFGNTVSSRRNALFGTGADHVYYDVGDFNILNVTNKVNFDLAFGQDVVVPVMVYFDYAWNEASANDAYETWSFSNLGKRNMNDALAMGFTLGALKKKGDVQFGYKYKHIEPNAVVGAFADANFGFANSEGHVIKLAYRLHDNVEVAGTMYFTEPIYDIDHTISSTPSLTVDLLFKF